MKFSMKSRYGLKALIDLAVNSKTDHVALNSIAERNGISPQYLEQVFSSFRKAGIVKSIKGPQGGYLLARDSREISISDILSALEGEYRIAPETIDESSEYRGSAAAIQKLVIEKVNRQLEDTLTEVTLYDLVTEFYEYNSAGQNMYYI